MKLHLLTKQEQQNKQVDFTHLKSNYLDKLQELENLISKGQLLNKEQQAQGLNIVKDYYKYLSDCGVKYGKVATSVMNKSNLIGKLADIQLVRQAMFEGISNINEIKPNLSIKLAYSDAKGRVDGQRELKSKEISDYHYEVYKQFGLPPYAWSGTLINKIGGSEMWEGMVNDEVFKSVLTNLPPLIANTTKTHIDGLSVNRLVSSFIDAARCTGTDLPPICSPSFNISDLSFLDSDPIEALAKKWDVDKTQVVKADPKASRLKYMNGDTFFFKDNEYYILPKTPQQNFSTVKPGDLLADPMINGLKDLSLKDLPLMSKFMNMLKWEAIRGIFLKKIDNLFKIFVKIKQEEIDKERIVLENKAKDDIASNVTDMNSKIQARKAELEQEANAYADKVAEQRLAAAKANAHITHPNGGTIIISAEDVRAQKIAEATVVLNNFIEQLQKSHDQQAHNIANNSINALKNKKANIQNTIDAQQEKLKQFVEQLELRKDEILNDDNNPDIGGLEGDTQDYLNNLQHLLGVDSSLCE